MRPLSFVLCVIVAGAVPAAAQSRPTPDFLFGEPRGSLGVRASWIFASAGQPCAELRGCQDLFSFVTQQLTLDRGDFNAPAIAADLGFAVGRRIDAVAGFEFSQTSASSEYRDFVDNDRQPIEQTTRLRAANVSGSVRVALTPRGTGVSRFAWIPRGATPYVGAGGGLLWYEFRQSGDFVDVLDPRLAIFNDVLLSKGWTPSAHAFGGVDLKVQRRTFLTFEGRYQWAAATLQQQFEGFEPIDLAGFRMSVGVNVLF
ncbi:MAG: hypothetical protein HY657_16895 [Acidobacteria bacterium]|nr:hypothetical protein [Acidobacteriota bacterium]